MKRPGVFLGATFGVIAVMIWLLATGGGNSGVGSSGKDEVRDVELTNGPNPPRDVAFVDLRSASVLIDGDEIVFEANVEGEIPGHLGRGNATWRWEIEEQSTVTWIVQANVNVEQSASILSTQVDFSGSTIAGDFPGELNMDEDTVQIVVQRDELDDFPETFEWVLLTEVDGDRAVTKSSLGSDRLPDGGSLEASS